MDIISRGMEGGSRFPPRVAKVNAQNLHNVVLCRDSCVFTTSCRGCCLRGRPQMMASRVDGHLLILRSTDRKLVEKQSEKAYNNVKIATMSYNTQYSFPGSTDLPIPKRNTLLGSLGSEGVSLRQMRRNITR